MMGYGGFAPGLIMGGAGWLWMVLGVLLWVGFVALVVWGTVALLDRRTHPVAPTPLEILRLRYARGEITEEEFEQARRALA